MRQPTTPEVHPRERFLTIYGRKPVLEALDDSRLQVAKVLIAKGAQGSTVAAIRRAAERSQVAVETVTAEKVKRLAGNGRHDQGVVADVVAARMRGLAAFGAELTDSTQALLLDGVTNPSNVGMILRTATAAGLDAVVVPHQGTAAVGPLAIKASAGVAFRAPIVRCRTAVEAVDVALAAGSAVVALDSESKTSLYEVAFAGPVMWVLGNETDGLSAAVAAKVTHTVAIPMSAGVESLNVASAGAVVCFEVARRRLEGGGNA